MATATKYKVIGTRPVRHDGVDKVTGRARYGADTKIQGMLYAAMLRSPHAHAKIKRIDTSKAEKLPGVRAVVTTKDLPNPGNRIAQLGEGAVCMSHLSQNVLARDKVLYKGHAIAAVAADNIHIAEEAVKLIEVEYEPLPVLLDVREAMKPSAIVLNDDVRCEEVGAGTTGDKPTNVAKHFHFEKGNLADGFAKAKVVVEREFTTGTVHQGYIEPHAATATWNPDGRVTIWCCTQGSFTVRQQCSELLGVPLGSIKVVPTEIGGGFGGKISVYLEPVAAALSKKSGKPVKLVMDRAAVLEATGPTPASYMKVKIGVDGDGKIMAASAYMAFDAGAFPGSPIGMAAMCAFACYDVPNGSVDGYDVCVNKPRTNAYRAPGATIGAFGVETVIDELCEKLKLDSLEFRAKNAAKEGTRRVDGPVFPRIGMWETVDYLKKSEHYSTPLPKPKFGGKVGRGVASGFWFNCGLKSAVFATVNTDGSVSLSLGTTDIGGSRASIAMQLAETLGLTASDINPNVVDTDAVGYNDVTGGSRVTFATGIAAYEAGLDIQRQMVQRAAVLWDVDPSKVRYAVATASLIGPEGKSITFKAIAEQVNHCGGPVIGRGFSSEANQGGAFGTHCVDVEVDPDTGKTQILRYTISQDVGTAIHPSYVEGQLQGGVVQGIGWALNEEYFYDDKGVMRNASFLDYRIPTIYDVPMIETILVEVPDPEHPFGVRGVGEVPIVPPPAAVANAIANAVGVRMEKLPMSPPNLLKEILAKK